MQISYYRMEMVKLRTSISMAKVAGAATIAFKRVPIGVPYTIPSKNMKTHVSYGATWVKGCFLMLTANTFWGLWLVLQVTSSIIYAFMLLFI